jgi:xylose isomerase
MREFYPGISKIRYEGSQTLNPLAFRYYNPEEVIGGKPMRQHLRFAMSYWHTMVSELGDMFGTGTISKKYGSTDPMTSAKNKAHAAFERYALEKGDVETGSGRQEYLEAIVNALIAG